MGGESKHESSHWDSAPLAFALLPAVGGMLFTNGSSVVTDIILLGLAAIFLNWSVRLPWYFPSLSADWDIWTNFVLGIGTTPPKNFERKKNAPARY